MFEIPKFFSAPLKFLAAPRGAAAYHLPNTAKSRVMEKYYNGGIAAIVCLGYYN